MSPVGAVKQSESSTSNWQIVLITIHRIKESEEWSRLTVTNTHLPTFWR